MESIGAKANFLKNDYTKVLTKLDAAASPKWGKMNVQQMIEHICDYVRIANGKTPMDVITEAERIPRMRAFLESEKTFPENTPNVLLADTPPPHRHATKEEAIAELQHEIDHFFEVFTNEPEKKLNNPFFGELNYDLQVLLLYKHSTHHLRQFSAMV
jgi:hypothetical protein